ncbi:MAG: DUF2334 domain-containing protein [Terrimicrobiaceae bacterium]
MQTPRPVLVVSIHDVSPLTQKRVADMLADLADLGVDRTSLLVIPDHHHKAPILEDAGFCSWLRETADRGHEVVLHGYYHLRPKGGGLRGALTTEVYTAGEGEFYDLSEEEAAARLEKGLREFQTAGFHPKGFIAPAWLLGEKAEAAVKAAGFDYTTRLKNFKNLKTGCVDDSQSLVWSVRAGWRRVASLWWNASLVRRLGDVTLLRFGLHPPDWDHPAIKRQILQLLRAALAGREAITYEDWLLRSRTR